MIIRLLKIVSFYITSVVDLLETKIGSSEKSPKKIKKKTKRKEKERKGKERKEKANLTSGIIVNYFSDLF